MGEAPAPFDQKNPSETQVKNHAINVVFAEFIASGGTGQPPQWGLCAFFHKVFPQCERRAQAPLDQPTQHGPDLTQDEFSAVCGVSVLLSNCDIRITLEGWGSRGPNPGCCGCEDRTDESWLLGFDLHQPAMEPPFFLVLRRRHGSHGTTQVRVRRLGGLLWRLPTRQVCTRENTKISPKWPGKKALWGGMRCENRS